MRLCRFDDDRLGVIQNDTVRDVTEVTASIGRPTSRCAHGDPLIAGLPNLRRRIEELAGQAVPCPLSEVALLSPVARPGKLVAAPVNYQAHLDEAISEPETFSAAHVRRIQETGLFLKATSSLVGPSEGVPLRFPDRRSDHEVELAVVIGHTASAVSPERALDVVAGYCIGLDMTVRGPEERSLRKSIDGYSVLGPWLVTADELGDPSGLSFGLMVDGETRQSANTRDLVLSVPELIAFASCWYTLHPGDVIFTGTPEGVGPVLPGNRITAWMERIGSMDVEIRSA